MEASPWPVELVAGIEIQLAFDDTDHEQSRVAAIDNDPDPPASVKLDGVLLTCIWHFCELGAVSAVEVWVDVHPATSAASASADASAGNEIRRRIFSALQEMHAPCQ